jgi:hypothetical protein
MTGNSAMLGTKVILLDQEATCGRLLLVGSGAFANTSFLCRRGTIAYFEAGSTSLAAKAAGQSQRPVGASRRCRRARYNSGT